MNLIIAGSRQVTSYGTLLHAIAAMREAWGPVVINEVVSGTARGVDQLGELWAARNGIQVRRFPADWKTLGRSAGYVRNTKMAAYADALLAIWTGATPGTGHMIDTATKAGLEVFVYRVPVTGSEG